MTHHDKARKLAATLRALAVLFEQGLALKSRDACLEAADLITAQAEALEYAEAKDTPDALTPQIKKACQAPGYWSIYAQALELVSNRYSKSALAHLAAFLMMREQAQVEENQRLREAVEAVIQFHNSTFSGPCAAQNKGRQWKGVLRKCLNALKQAGAEPTASP